MCWSVFLCFLSLPNATDNISDGSYKPRCLYTRGTLLSWKRQWNAADDYSNDVNSYLFHEPSHQIELTYRGMWKKKSPVCRSASSSLVCVRAQLLSVVDLHYSEGLKCERRALLVKINHYTCKIPALVAGSSIIYFYIGETFWGEFSPIRYKPIWPYKGHIGADISVTDISVGH